MDGREQPGRGGRPTRNLRGGGVGGLAGGTFYHWRARTVSADPFFPRSPWMSLAGNNMTETKLRTAGCVDHDGDGFGDFGDPACLSLVADCDDDDGTSWATPSETRNLRFPSKTMLAWDAPSAPGALLSELDYDTLRTGLVTSFGAAADCVESNDGPNTTAVDVDAPSSGQVFFYLNRAENACPAGVGSLGTDSEGVHHTGRSCP